MASAVIILILISIKASTTLFNYLFTLLMSVIIYDEAESRAIFMIYTLRQSIKAGILENNPVSHSPEGEGLVHKRY